ncbi:hypothetical protein JAAARDRAFT_211560 [Jaapia argillacea MUCL 33604]|uniref:Phosphatidate phosphatase APP1 catalytic domain-containing protein n=1 Tax=Jaapia argillacea MUCL 33604 TaxID=933084 RepID=A0A067PI88_9AGAM|nr:hypothetical protein JAAARDRAFT_211560 [Jaapia argillacea MUCL 33604]
MSSDMSSRRSLLSSLSRISTSSVKSYLQQGDYRAVLPSSLRRELRPGDPGYIDGGPRKQSWGQWANEKIRRSGGSDRLAVEKISLFPGWATRRFRGASSGADDPFDIEIFISGYASSNRNPEYSTRAQRAFLRLAKGFASLPKLSPNQSSPPSNPPSGSITPLTQELLQTGHLPPRPSEITEESEIAALEQSLRVLATQECDTDESVDGASRRTSIDSSEPVGVRIPNRPMDSFSSGNGNGAGSSLDSNSSSLGVGGSLGRIAPAVAENIHRLHTNLESRLQPFWSSALSSRTIRLSIFPPNPNPNEPNAPIAIEDVQTQPDGSFKLGVVVPWDRICTHPGALDVAFGDRKREFDFLVQAELLPPPPSLSSTPTPTPSYLPYHSHHLHNPLHLPPPNPNPTSSIPIPLTHSPIRVISDIDDTIKISNILSGARTVFQNVFVKELSEVVIPGMGGWYRDMWEKGVRFHYVSNGPFELLPVLNEFLQISRLPAGSLKLRSYAGRSLFNGLLTAPAARKRTGVTDVLSSFPQSQFFLIGDSGEQDLELYASIAAEKPEQILGVFIRDVNGPSPQQGSNGGTVPLQSAVEPVEDPIGQVVLDLGIKEGAGLDRDATLKARPPPSSFVKRPIRAMSELITSPNSSTMGPNGLSTPIGKPPGRTHSMGDQPTLSVPVPQQQSTDYFSSRPPTTTRNTIFPGTLTSEPLPLPSPTPSSRSSIYKGWSRPPSRQGSTATTSSMGDAEKKRADLQARIWKARSEIPKHIPLRIFREAEECVEAWQILMRDEKLV